MKWKRFSLAFTLTHAFLVQYFGINGKKTVNPAIKKGIIHEKLLHSTLLDDYNAEVRPFPAVGHPLIVHFRMGIKQLMELDVKEQVLKLTAFLVFKWHDPQLQWNVSEYGNTSRINFEASSIWTPDVILLNTADETSYAHTDLYKTKAQVESSGLVHWNNIVTWKSSCDLDITWFPVDRQTCNMTFGSWSYSRSKIDLKLIQESKGRKFARSDHFYVTNGVWDIKSVTMSEGRERFSCCPEEFSTITYTLVLKRMSRYYFLYILSPLIGLSFLFLVAYHLPVDDGANRVTYGITVLLSITVYLLVISEKLPEKSTSVPVVGVCFVLNFCLLCLSIVLMAITSMLARRKGPAPQWLIKCRRAMRSSCCQKHEYEFVSKKYEHEDTGSLETVKETIERMHEVRSRPKYSTDEPILPRHSINSISTIGSATSFGHSYEEASWREMMKFMDRIQFFTFLILLTLTPFIVIAVTAIETTTGLAI